MKSRHFFWSLLYLIRWKGGATFFSTKLKPKPTLLNVFSTNALPVWLMRVVDVPISILVECCHGVVILFCSNVKCCWSVGGVKHSILVKLAVPDRGGAWVFVRRVDNGTQEYPGGQSGPCENTSVGTLWEKFRKEDRLSAWVQQTRNFRDWT